MSLTMFYDFFIAKGLSLSMMYDFLIATGETLYMVFASTVFSILIGLPLGTLLFTSSVVKPNRFISRFISALINITRSIPFIILLVAIIPFTRLLAGTSIGIHAAMVPLTIGAAPFFARLVSNAYHSLPQGLIESGYAMGANPWQMIRFILLPEAMPQLIHATTVTGITLINYSAMAGTVGGGGLGDLAIRYGYQRFNGTVMFATVLILVIIVQLLQMSGDYFVNRFEMKGK